VNHAVITGGAGAIGAALARAFRARWPDARLTLVDRDGDGAAAIAADVDGTATSADLADLGALPALVDAIAADGGSIDGLVNCAGVMTVRHVADWQWRDAEALLAIDLLAPLRLQDLVLPSMLAMRRGTIVNVASMAGRVPLKGCTYYGAAKAGLGMASEIARADLTRRGIGVVTVYPGPVRSALERGARAQYRRGGGVLGRLAPLGDPAVLAARVVDAIDTGAPRVIYPATYALGWLATNLASRFTLRFGPAPALT
jgi:short-subunit dehydrogenase